MTQATATPDWRRRHALGLPNGSVRALLALGVIGTACGLLLREPDRQLPDHLESLLFVVLGHYFAARGQAPVDPDGGPPPLYLPRGSVRVLLVAALVGVGVMVLRQGGAEAARGLVTLVLVFAFLLGIVISRVVRWWQRRRPDGPRVFKDLQALVGIAAVSGVALQAFTGVLPGPEELGFGRVGVEQALAGLVGFYFGARS